MPSVVVPSVHVNVQPVPPCTDAVSVSTPLQLVLPLTAMLAVSGLTVQCDGVALRAPAGIRDGTRDHRGRRDRPNGEIVALIDGRPERLPGRSANLNGPRAASLVVHSRSVAFPPQSTGQLSWTPVADVSQSSVVLPRPWMQICWCRHWAPGGDRSGLVQPAWPGVVLQAGRRTRAGVALAPGHSRLSEADAPGAAREVLQDARHDRIVEVLAASLARCGAAAVRILQEDVPSIRKVHCDAVAACAGDVPDRELNLGVERASTVARLVDDDASTDYLDVVCCTGQVAEVVRKRRQRA